MLKNPLDWSKWRICPNATKSPLNKKKVSTAKVPWAKNWASHRNADYRKMLTLFNAKFKEVFAPLYDHNLKERVTRKLVKKLPSKPLACCRSAERLCPFRQNGVTQARMNPRLEFRANKINCFLHPRWWTTVFCSSFGKRNNEATEAQIISGENHLQLHLLSTHRELLLIGQ